MSSPLFKTTVHGKWILTGEHTVLRGGSALVFPIPDRAVSLAFSASPPNSQKTFDVTFSGDYGDTLLLVFWGLIEEGLKLIEKSHADLTGQVDLSNTITMGAGMGFSAALCVAMSQWFCWLDWLDKEDLFSFARNLENFFHSQSSGVDIAGALYNQGVCFTKDPKPAFELIKPTWNPHLYLSHSDEVSITAQCIKTVQALSEKNPTLGDKIDQQMHQTSLQAKAALQDDAADGQNKLDALTKAIKQANHCFEQWGLIKEGVKTHQDKLTQAGALATKPTGAGNGGYVLSLWDKPPEGLGFELIPLST